MNGNIDDDDNNYYNNYNSNDYDNTLALARRSLPALINESKPPFEL